MGICHRDLKPENFIFETKDLQSDLKVIDFGLSKITEGGTSKSQRSIIIMFSQGYALKNENQSRNSKFYNQIKLQPYYLSPEVLIGNYDISCDMWSAGCILYILLCGYPPFYGEDDQEILRAVVKGEFEFEGEEWLEVSD